MILIYPSVASTQFKYVIDCALTNKILTPNNILILKQDNVSGFEFDGVKSVSIEDLLISSNIVIKDSEVLNSPFTICEIVAANRNLENKNIHSVVINLQYQFLNLLINYGITRIISYSLSDSVTMSLYNAATNLNINFEYIIAARLGERVLISNRIDSGPINFIKLLNDNRNEIANDILIRKKVFSELSAFLNKKIQPLYASNKYMVANGFFKFNYINIYRKFCELFDFKRKSNFVSDGFFALVLKRFIRYLLVAYYKRNVDVSNSEQLNEKKYLIFPLHLHPEAATLVQGRWLNDQIAIIDLISRNLPIGVKLLVKEHKVALGRRDISFYKKIVSLPNVSLVDVDVSMFDLIMKSSGVLTISGTAGLEGILCGKNVGVFGDVFYMHCDGVHLMHDYSKTRSNLLNIINQTKNPMLDRLALYKTIIESSDIIYNYDQNNLTSDCINKIVEMYFKND